MRKPNLFIVGEPKSGTTALNHFLVQHPDIAFSKVREPHHFAADLPNKKKKYRKREDYLGLFDHVKDENIVGDRSVYYLLSRDAAREIHKFNPDAKIIMMFREPVELIYSLHSQHLYSYHENVKDFKKAVEIEELRRKGKKLPRGVDPEVLYYKSDLVRFKEHAERFYRYFPKENIKLILHDDFKKDNEKVFSEVLEFLGVDSEFKADFSIVNPNMKTRFSLLRKIGEARWVWALPKKILPRKLYDGMKNIFYKVAVDFSPRKSLDPDFRKELKRKFKPEVQKFSEYIGRDLIKKWGYDED